VWIAALTFADALAFLNIGIGRTISRHVARTKNLGARDSFLETAYLAHLFFGIIGIIAFTLAARYIPKQLGVPQEGFSWAVPLFALTGAIFFFNQLFSFCSETLVGQLRSRVPTLITAFTSLLRFCGILVLYLTGMTPLRVGSLYFAIALMAALTSMFLADLPSLGVRLVPTHIPFRSIVHRLQFGALSQLAAALTAVSWQFGPLFLGFAFGAAKITSYYLGMRIPAVLLTAAWNLAIVLFPAASKWSEHEENSHTVLRVGARLALVVVAPAAIILLCIPEYIFAAWLGTVPTGAVTVLRLGTLTVLIEAIATSSIQLLWGHGVMRVILRGTLTTAAITVILTVALAKHLALSGTAIALCTGVALSSGYYIRAALERTNYSFAGFLHDLLEGLALPLISMTVILLGLVTSLKPQRAVEIAALCLLSCTSFYLVFWKKGANQEERLLFTRVFARLQRSTRFAVE
jgi:O-antigen/teichoic acid export membrane protein